IQRRPPTPLGCQWATFVRNHDELTLDKLTERQRQEVFDAFGPDPEMQVYGRGLRRRIPPMLDGDPRRIRMVYSLLFSLPGTPVLFYGEEIGMAENLDIEGRMSVRAPMQWSEDLNGGFTTSTQPCRPVVDAPRWGPAEINVGRQRRDDGSLLNWMERLIRRRRECPEIGWGRARVLDAGDPAVFAHRCDWGASALLAIHSFAETPSEVAVPVDGVQAAVDLFADEELRPNEEGAVVLKLEPYDQRWYRLRKNGEQLPP
ncbi:MAG: trehalose synthase, partial [Actinomycetota bacterium]